MDVKVEVAKGCKGGGNERKCSALNSKRMLHLCFDISKQNRRLFKATSLLRATLYQATRVARDETFNWSDTALPGQGLVNLGGRWEMSCGICWTDWLESVGRWGSRVRGNIEALFSDRNRPGWEGRQTSGNDLENHCPALVRRPDF
jgi:hypothetical protein